MICNKQGILGGWICSALGNEVVISDIRGVRDCNSQMVGWKYILRTSNDITSRRSVGGKICMTWMGICYEITDLVSRRGVASTILVKIISEVMQKVAFGINLVWSGNGMIEMIRKREIMGRIDIF